jgi:hypothetical protein
MSFEERVMSFQNQNFSAIILSEVFSGVRAYEIARVTQIMVISQVNLILLKLLLFK